MKFTMRARRGVCLALLPAFLALTTRAGAWGVAGHRYINSVAIDDLPLEMRGLYAANRAWIVEHSSDPDHWREQNRAEGPAHFIDLDTWGIDAAARFPNNYWQACGQYGKAAVDKNGTVPWRIGQYYGKLVRAFREHDARGIVEISTWLGHYAGDIHVPFHACANYDGQLTGQRGVHARFESVLVERQIKLGDVKARPAIRLADPTNAAFGWARTSLRASFDVLQEDKAAVAKDPAYGDPYYKAFGERTRAIALRRLSEGAQDLASLWYSAWLDAGKPALPAATDTHGGETLAKPTHDPDLPAPVSTSTSTMQVNPTAPVSPPTASVTATMPAKPTAP